MSLAGGLVSRTLLTNVTERSCLSRRHPFPGRPATYISEQFLCRLNCRPVDFVPEGFGDDVCSQWYSHVKTVRICGLRRGTHVVEREMNPARCLVIDGQCPSVGLSCEFFESIVVQGLAISILDLAKLLASQEPHGDVVDVGSAGDVMRSEQRVELKAQQRGSYVDVVRVHCVDERVYHPVAPLDHGSDDQVGQVKVAFSSHQ